MMRKRLVSLILAFLILALSAGAAAMQPSPDSALGVILAFAGHIRERDFEGALSLTTTSSASSRYQHSKMIELMRALVPQGIPLLPPDYAPYEPLAANYFLGHQNAYLSRFLFSLLIPGFDPQRLAILKDDQLDIGRGGTISLAELHKRLDPERLGGLELRHVLKMTGGFFADEHYIQQNKKRGEIYGFQEIEEYYVIYALEDQLFLTACQVALYEEGWQLLYLSSPMAEIDELSRDGSALLISQESVDDLLADSECCQVVYPLKP